MKDEEIKEFEGLFDLPEESKGEEEETEQSDFRFSDAQNDTFDNSVSLLQKDLSEEEYEVKDMGHKPEEKSEVTMGEKIKKACEKPENSQENKSKETENFMEFDFDEIDSSSSVEEEDEKQEEDEPANKIDMEEEEEVSDHVPKEKVVDNVLIIDDMVQWLLTPPSEKYDSFYEKKIQAIQDIVGDQEIPYSAWYKEIKQSKVEIEDDVWDSHKIYSYMDIIQRYRDRITEIEVSCNEQYYYWERFLELMRGNLARVAYEKPIVRQDGVIYEHMRDLEVYWRRLKIIKESCEKVTVNLDKAYASLSRKVTIILGSIDEVVRYGKREEEEEIHHKPKKKVISNYDSSDYDELPQGSKAGPRPTSQTGVVEWGDIV